MQGDPGFMNCVLKFRKEKLPNIVSEVTTREEFNLQCCRHVHKALEFTFKLKCRL